jgi:hypothetical protein
MDEGENFGDMVLAPEDGEKMRDIKTLTAAGKAAGERCYTLL